MFAIGAYGAVFVAPFAHNWLILLEKLMPVSSASSLMFPRLVGKVSTDLAFAGTIITYSYLLWRGIVEGNTVSETNKSIAATFWPIYKANLYVWFPAQLMNFMLVPLPYRVLYHNSVLFAWNTYLAYEASKVFAKDPVVPESKE
jgi:protein Mpv17